MKNFFREIFLPHLSNIAILLKYVFDILNFIVWENRPWN